MNCSRKESRVVDNVKYCRKICWIDLNAQTDYQSSITHRNVRCLYFSWCQPERLINYIKNSRLYGLNGDHHSAPIFVVLQSALQHLNTWPMMIDSPVKKLQRVYITFPKTFQSQLQMCWTVFLFNWFHVPRAAFWTEDTEDVRVRISRTSILIDYKVDVLHLRSPPNVDSHAPHNEALLCCEQQRFISKHWHAQTKKKTYLRWRHKACWWNPRQRKNVKQVLSVSIDVWMIKRNNISQKLKFVLRK